MQSEVIEAHERTMLRKAVAAGAHCVRPRRWLAQFGELPSCVGTGAAALNAEYRSTRKRIAAKVPKIKISAEWR